MENREYSAGFMAQAVWFIEFKKIVQLISAGKTRIVTDAPGRAVKEGRQWKIVQQATIHYE